MLKIGITGGIGSGKTTVCKIFSCLGVPIYYADDNAKTITNNSPLIKKQIIDNFGKDVYEDGILNRKKLADIVFNDKEKLNKLNSIIHPEVEKHFNQWLNQHSEAKYIIQESAILFESGFEKHFDKIICMMVPINHRIERILKRENTTKENILKIAKTQMPDDKKFMKSDYIIYNYDDHFLIPQVLEIHKKLTSII